MSTIEIELTRGKCAIVDAPDEALVRRFKWNAISYGSCWYAIGGAPGAWHLKMHRLIIAAPYGVEVDHANRNGLDNRRSNLRLATRRDNVRNRKSGSAGKTSQYHGVRLVHRTGRWQACIRIGPIGANGASRSTHLGYFIHEDDAARAYDAAARAHFGAFAVLNFTDEQAIAVAAIGEGR